MKFIQIPTFRHIREQTENLLPLYSQSTKILSFPWLVLNMAFERGFKASGQATHSVCGWWVNDGLPGQRRISVPWGSPCSKETTYLNVIVFYYDYDFSFFFLK